MSNKILFSIGYYPDSSKGKPLANGSIYIGIVDTDPEIPANQKYVTALQEDGSQVVISQPIEISAGGVPLYNGSPVSLYTTGDYSMKVLDGHGVQEYYIPYSSLTDADEVRVFESVADMTAATLTEGSTYITQGYRLPGDGGGGTYLAESLGAAYDGYVNHLTDDGTLVAVLQFTGTLNVLKAGAYNDNTNTTDTTESIQACIDYIGTIDGGVVYLPAGDYAVNDVLDIEIAGTYLQGDGKYVTTIQRSSDYGDTIYLHGDATTGTRINDVGVKDLGIKSNALTTTGAHIHGVGVTRLEIANIYLLFGFVGFKLDGVTASTMDGLRVEFTNIHGGSDSGRAYMRFNESSTNYSHPSCGDVFISNFNLRGSTTSTVTETGIHVTSADGIWFSNGHIGNTTFANLLVDHTSSTENLNLLFFDNVMFDRSNGVGIFYRGSDTTTARDHKFSNCELSGGTSATTGISFASGSDFENISFDNCTVRWFTQHGILLSSTATHGIRFTGCTVRANSFGNSGTYNNLQIAANVDGVEVNGGKYGGAIDYGDTIYTGYGISITGTSSNIQVSDANVSDNLTGGMLAGALDAESSVRNMHDTTTSRDVASATTLVPLQQFDILTVTGTTTINSVAGAGVGKVLTLFFEDALIVNDSVGNLRLNGTLNTSTGTTLVIYYDGSVWYELSRSIN